MKPALFQYHAPATLADALALLGDLGEEAKILAGGQSLVPSMNFRLARPANLVDINRIAPLQYIRQEGSWLVIGALTRQRTVEHSALVKRVCPLLAQAASLIGHVAIRTRGTVGGSLAHADPAAELPGAVAALGGLLQLTNRHGSREVTPEQFFLGYLTTCAFADEMLTQVRVPVMGPRTGQAFVEQARREGDFALVGAAVSVTLDDQGAYSDVRIALISVGASATRAQRAEQHLRGTQPSEDAHRAAGASAATDAEPFSDIHAPDWYRREMIAVVVREALTQAAQRAGAWAA